MTEFRADEDGIIRAAGIDPTGTYRWWLTRRWGESGAWCNFLMLNPSTADGSGDDPTIRRVIRFARDWGFVGVVVTNLFAYRATDPDRLRTAPDPVGRFGDQAISNAAELSAYTVCAWGSNPKAADRAKVVLGMLREQNTDVRALRVARSGAPWHPLYLPAATTPVAYTEGL